jgi:hypothetical protein
MENKDQIIDKIEKLRSEYKVELEDSQEDTLSFLDRIDDLIKSIFNDSSISVYDAFSQENLDKWKKRRLFRFLKNLITNNLQNTLYFILLATITGFLVSEALEFYADSGVLDTKTYAKAILTEVCFIFLSGYRSDNTIQKIGVGALRVSIFCLMLFVITSEITLKGTRDIDQIDNLADRIARIEKQIDSINKEIDYYKSIDWKWRMTQGIKKRDELEKQVQELKEKQSESGTKEVSKLLQYKIYGKAAFRVILLMISVLITRRLFKF